jgi:hypothetical protein
MRNCAHGQPLPSVSIYLRKSVLSEIGEGGRFGFECGDGVDQAGDGEGVADATGAADQAEIAAFAGQLDGNANQRGDAGAVDLRNAIQDDHHFAGAMFDHGFQSVVKLFAGFANGQAAVNVEHGDGPAFANINFHWGVVGHGDKLSIEGKPAGGWRPFLGVHYTMKAHRGGKRLVKFNRGRE